MADVWTNNTWANWLKENGVPEETRALVSLKWATHGDVPVKVVDISKHGLSDFGMKSAPLDATYYQYVWWSKLGKEHFVVNYSIGFSFKFKGKNQNKNK